LTNPFNDRSITVDYRSQFDELRVDDRSRLPERRPSTDIGEKTAENLAKAAISALAANGVIAQDQYAIDDMATGHHQREEYAGDGKPTVTYTVEYRFRMLRKLNGIDVANSAVVIGITPDGQLSSVRLGGVQFETQGSGTSVTPAGIGSIFERAVSAEAIAERFNREVGGVGNAKHIVWSKKMYVMPSDVTEATLEPMMVYRFALMATSSRGSTIVGKAQTLGYSLADANIAPADYSTR
jgi:phosphate-selective porin